MKNYKLLIALTATLASTTLFSCAKTDTDALQSAQACLNNAAPSAAEACVSGISSNSSAFASSLRCSAIFISQGYNTPSSFLNAIDAINSPETCSGGTCSSTVNALVSFNFTTNLAATQAFNECSASGVKFYTQLSSLFKIGTEAKILSGFANPTAQQIADAIGTISDTTMGQIVTTTYSSVCTDLTSASDATKKYCAELKAAIEAPTSTTAGIGACLKAKLANPAAVCT
ncbi:hypothetical protein K2P97_07750 [bacterium]|nr:hypothetical protein [bacterium]